MSNVLVPKFLSEMKSLYLGLGCCGYPNSNATTAAVLALYADEKKYRMMIIIDETKSSIKHGLEQKATDVRLKAHKLQGADTLLEYIEKIEEIGVCDNCVQNCNNCNEIERIINEAYDNLSQYLSDNLSNN